MDIDIEKFLLLIIVIVALYIIIDFFASTPAPAVVLGGAVGILAGKHRDDNLKHHPVDPHKLANKIKNNYDEYDDHELLTEADQKKYDSIDNIVIDGNNFIYRYREDVDRSNSQMGTSDFISYINKVVKLIVKHFPDKSLYFVFKDPETETQEKELKEHFKVDSVRKAHKKLFGDIAKQHPKARFVIAYGDAKYRDDYAAIWLADSLPDDTILLSRDRYKDVSKMESIKLKFVVYGKKAKFIDKIINKPFSFVTRGSVKSTLVGYSFDKKTKSGFYNKDVNKGSYASDCVYVFKTKDI